MNPRATSRRTASRALPRSMRHAAAAAVTLTLLAGTAACSSNSSGGAEEPAPPATIDTPKNGGPAKVTLTEDAMRRIDPYSNGGGKVNDNNLFARPMAVLRPEAAARLEELRATHDPEGRFDAYPCELPLARAG